MNPPQNPPLASNTPIPLRLLLSEAALEGLFPGFKNAAMPAAEQKGRLEKRVAVSASALFTGSGTCSFWFLPKV